MPCQMVSKSVDSPRRVKTAEHWLKQMVCIELVIEWFSGSLSTVRCFNECYHVY
jgi:hypothetical protein